MSATPPNPDGHLSRGRLLFSGEHWINYLRLPGSGRDSTMVSIYRGRFSPAGPGTAAYVRIEGEAGFAAACTDSPAFERFIRETMYRNEGPFAGLPVVSARFRQEGNVRGRPGESPPETGRSAPSGAGWPPRTSVRRPCTPGSSSPSSCSLPAAASSSTAGQSPANRTCATAGRRTSAGRTPRSASPSPRRWWPSSPLIQLPCRRGRAIAGGKIEVRSNFDSCAMFPLDRSNKARHRVESGGFGEGA